MTEREILLNTMKHIGSGVVPYALGFDCPVLEEKVNEHYGVNWRTKARRFTHSTLHVDTKREVRIDGTHYARDIFGSVWRMDQLPWHLEKPILPEPSFAGYTFPALDDFLAPLEQNNSKRKAKEANGRSPHLFRIINMGWGIFEQTWRICGFEETMCNIAAEEQFYAELVDKITELYVGMVEYCADVEADAFLFGDDWGSQNGIIIGPEKWRKFIKPAWKRVYDKVHEQGKYVISHSCGSVYDILPDAIEIGLDMLESVQPEAYGMDPFKLKREFGGKLGFWGALGSQSVVPFWKPDEIKEHIRRLKAEMGKSGGYILAPAKPFQPETPLENVIAIIDELTT